MISPGSLEVHRALPSNYKKMGQEKQKMRSQRSRVQRMSDSQRVENQM